MVLGDFAKKGRCDMCLSPDIYKYGYLKQADKDKVDIVEIVKQRTMDDSLVEDFLEANPAVSSTMESVYAECIRKFLAYQRERAEYYKVDIIVDSIDGYSDEEYQALCDMAAAEK